MRSSIVENPGGWAKGWRRLPRLNSAVQTLGVAHQAFRGPPPLRRTVLAAEEFGFSLCNCGASVKRNLIAPMFIGRPFSGEEAMDKKPEKLGVNPWNPFQTYVTIESAIQAAKIAAWPPFIFGIGMTIIGISILVGWDWSFITGFTPEDQFEQIVVGSTYIVVALISFGLGAAVHWKFWWWAVAVSSIFGIFEGASRFFALADPQTLQSGGGVLVSSLFFGALFVVCSIHGFRGRLAVSKFKAQMRTDQ
jgi:hypothetical protein